MPSDAEVRILQTEAEPELAAAIVMMGQGGLRVGALPGISITGARWSSTTKGREQSGRVPEEARQAIMRAGLPLRSPFAGVSGGAIADRFRRLVLKLHAAGKLQARYSAHDLRHAYAVRLYEATHDVYQVEKALGHANVAVTEGYLRSLGLVGGSLSPPPLRQAFGKPHHGPPRARFRGVSRRHGVLGPWPMV